MEGIAIFNTFLEIDPSPQFEEGIYQIVLTVWKDNWDNSKCRVSCLSIEGSLNLLAKPSLRSVSTDADGTASRPLKTLSHFLLPVLSRNQYPLVQPDRQVRLVHEPSAELLHQGAVNVRVTEKHVEGRLSFHVGLPRTRYNTSAMNSSSPGHLTQVLPHGMAVLAADLIRQDHHESCGPAVVDVKPAEHFLDRDRLGRSMIGTGSAGMRWPSPWCPAAHACSRTYHLPTHPEQGVVRRLLARRSRACAGCLQRRRSRDPLRGGIVIHPAA
jgi:hypothetical protein